MEVTTSTSQAFRHLEAMQNPTNSALNQSITTPLVAVVLPSLNEESRLRETCKSLGFYKSTSQPAPGTFLFIVDNGSTDRTLEVAWEIQQHAPPGSIFIGEERARGYVPPRHTGNTMVKSFAEHNGLDPTEILILQADADTFYEDGYIECMRSASRSLGCNMLLEGLAEFSQEFRGAFPGYITLSNEVDTRTLALLKITETSNLICTDAVCGYRLTDYFAWGGHLREYREDGDEIHAETTRLYMRALAHGARKVSVQEALAYPAERKITGNPVEEFATAGFPREESWRAQWKRQHHNLISLDDFRTPSNHPAILHAINVRERHLVALFGLLPVHVDRAMGRNLILPAHTAVRSINVALPERHRQMLSLRPGVFITDVLNIVDRHGPLLNEFLVSQGRR